MVSILHHTARFHASASRVSKGPRARCHCGRGRRQSEPQWRISQRSGWKSRSAQRGATLTSRGFSNIFLFF